MAYIQARCPGETESAEKELSREEEEDYGGRESVAPGKDLI